MIRSLAYYLVICLAVVCSIMSLATGEGGLHEFDINAPDDALDYVTFLPALVVDFVQFVVSCVSWEFAPGLPTDLRIILVALSALPVAAVLIMDVLPAIVNAVTSTFRGIFSFFT